MPATSGAGLFARELRRAVAQRGRLDPVYQQLSDHWTLILQRLYPVWALVGPELADPAHIELRSRTIYLDSDALLGTRAELLAGTLERRRVLACLGVGLHEVMHAKHTKRWVADHDQVLSESEDAADRQLALDRALLEEPRMEAHGCRDFPTDSTRGRFVRAAISAAVADVIVPVFAGQVAMAALAGRPLTREMCGRAMTYLQARTHYGVVDPAALMALAPIWEQVLGRDDVAALDGLYARVIWIPDGEIEPLTDAATRYREIVGPPEPAEASRGKQPGEGEGAGADGSGFDGHSGDPGSPAGGRDAADGGEFAESDAAGTASIGSLAEALEHALAATRDGVLVQLDEDVRLADVVARAATAPSTPHKRRGAGTGAPTGRIPDRGVDRPPFTDELRHARRYAQRLAQAITAGTRQTDKRTPGGNFDGRAYARGRAQQLAGRPASSHPWRVVRNVRAPIEAPHVVLIIDTSGSMAALEYALGPIAWILHEGLRTFGGRLAIALFGDGAELLSDGATRLREVPGIQTGGGTAFAGDALELASDRLEMTNPRRPRFVYVLSDGGWYDTQAGVERIRALRAHGVPTIHISIGAEPLSVEADRIVVISDPADALDRIAADTVSALRAAGRPAPRRLSAQPRPPRAP
jgi:Mg-chelatase subunit ChlD